MRRPRKRTLFIGAPVVLLIAGGYSRFDPVDFSLLLGGFVLLLVGAELLVRGAVAIAQRIGVSSLLVGLTVVAFGTSAPELAAGIQAALADTPEINVGTVVGSNIANIGLILGVTAMVFPVTCRISILRREVPFMILVGVIGYVAMRDGLIDRVEGGLLLGLLLAFVGFSYFAGKREGESEKHAEQELKQEFGIAPLQRLGPWIGPVLVLAGLFGLAFGADLLVTSTRNIALDLGVAPVVISLTLVAFGTSLPELATCVVAALRREPDIVLGNVLGSNIFNILFVFGVTSVIEEIPIPASVVSADWFIASDSVVMVLFSLLCFPMMLTGGKLSRLEGCLLFLSYLAYIIVVFVLTNR